jgi:MFS family permease
MQLPRRYALASAIAAPLGSFMGGLVGWRGAFFCVVPLAVVTVIWQCLTLPRLPAEKRSDADGMLALLRNRHFAIGMLAVPLSFMGQFTLFTYLRPFLEHSARHYGRCDSRWRGVRLPRRDRYFPRQRGHSPTCRLGRFRSQPNAWNICKGTANRA